MTKKEIVKASDEELIEWANSRDEWNEFSLSCLSELAKRYGYVWNPNKVDASRVLEDIKNQIKGVERNAVWDCVRIMNKRKAHASWSEISVERELKIYVPEVDEIVYMRLIDVTQINNRGIHRDSHGYVYFDCEDAIEYKVLLWNSTERCFVERINGRHCFREDSTDEVQGVLSTRIFEVLREIYGKRMIGEDNTCIDILGY